jgi:hypothetical protein
MFIGLILLFKINKKNIYTHIDLSIIKENKKGLFMSDKEIKIKCLELAVQHFIEIQKCYTNSEFGASDVLKIASEYKEFITS